MAQNFAQSTNQGNDVTMEIDDATALKLLLHSKAGGGESHKESISHEEAPLVILGVPCIVDYGFSFSRKQFEVVTQSCVWIFSGSSSDFFGSFYLPVGEESHASSILNLTIAHAIEQAKANPKFKAMLRSAAPAGVVLIGNQASPQGKSK